MGIYRGNEGRPGAIIREVSPDSPAAEAGFLAKDKIIEFDGRPVLDAASLVRLVSQTEVDSEVDVKVVRGEEELLLHPQIAQRTVPSLSQEQER